MTTSFEHGYALLIGVDANAVAKWALPDVAKDIVALREVLVHPERCAYPADHVKTLTGKEATRQGILDGLEWLSESVQQDSAATAVIYYTGHGWRDTSQTPADFYLIPYDVKTFGLQTRALRATDFAAEIAGMQPQRLLVILDCCHAAGMGVKEVALLPAGYVSAALAPEVLMPDEPGDVTPGAKGLETLAQGRGRAVLSASTGKQSSYIRQDRKMSIFTYHLIEALTGHAQPRAGAQDVLVSDVMSHVYRRVPVSTRADWGKEQTPDYQVSGNFPVAQLLGGKGLSKGITPPDPLETLSPAKTVFDQRGQTVGTQTNIAGNVTGPVLSGKFAGPVAVGGGEAVDLRGSQGAVYKPSAPVKQHFGDSITIRGDGNVVGNNNRVNVNKSQATGVTLDEFLRVLSELRQALPQAGLDPDVAEVVTSDVQTVATQAQKPKPNGAIILAKLNGVLQMLATADGVWGLTERILPLVQHALDAAKQLFGT
ncbi:MAG: caspase family protein [Anaerolineae bacterium]|nr:caspase family protein [Anaerolineae bacterium]